MPCLTAFHKISQNREKPRIWLESRRLDRVGFPAGTPYSIERTRGGLTIVHGGSRNVSSRRQAGNSRPIIEITGSLLTEVFPGIDAIKALCRTDRIEIRPTFRAAAILKSRSRTGPFRAFELFAGGGTLSDAASQCPAIELTGGAEFEPAYADAWCQKHPDAEMFQGDIRLIHPAELPSFDILIAGIPCTSHSTMGRAKKKLAGRPEEGDTGDLFAWVLNIVAHRPPAACVFENVPSFGTSLAGTVLKSGLSHLGYHLHETTLEPHAQWGEPSDRRRWVLIATLHPGFAIEPPESPQGVTCAQCLDPDDPQQDFIDAQRIAKTIEGLRAHNARHAALGHGFAFTTITRDTQKVPTIAKSYHKINTGPFVETPHGPRLLRLHEAEALMGSSAGTDDYTTGIQIIGQGVQTRLWSQIFRQLTGFLRNPEAHRPEPNPTSTKVGQGELDFGADQ